MKRKVWIMAAGMLAMTIPATAQEANLALTEAVVEKYDSMLGVNDAMQEAEEVLYDVTPVHGGPSSLDRAFSKRLGWSDDDDDERSRRKRRRFRTESSWNLELGLNNFLTGLVSFPDADNELYALDTWGSFYFAVSRNYSTKLAGPLYIEYGASVSWYNFQFQNPDVRVEKGDELVFSEFSDTTGTFVSVRSKLQTPYVNIHFVPVIDFSKGTLDRSYQGRGLRLGLGGYVGYRIGGHSKVVFKENGDRQRRVQKGNYYFENLRYGLRGQIGFRGVDLFLNYDLNEVFAKGKGPSLNAFSFGLVF